MCWCLSKVSFHIINLSLFLLSFSHGRAFDIYTNTFFFFCFLYFLAYFCEHLLKTADTRSISFVHPVHTWTAFHYWCTCLINKSTLIDLYFFVVFFKLFYWSSNKIIVRMHISSGYGLIIDYNRSQPKCLWFIIGRICNSKAKIYTGNITMYQNQAASPNNEEKKATVKKTNEIHWKYDTKQRAITRNCIERLWAQFDSRRRQWNEAEKKINLL